MKHIKEYKEFKELSERSGELYSPRRKRLQVFEPIDDNELEKEFFELIKIAYQAVGGHKKIQKPADVFADPEWDYWEGVDLHDDRDFDVIMFGKRTKYGVKFSGVGHDGQKDSKRAYLDARGDDLKELGKYIEVSDKIAEILMNKYKVPVVEDQDTVEKVLGRKVKWEGKHPTDKDATGNGWYTRKLGGKMHSKILLGRPRI